MKVRHRTLWQNASPFLVIEESRNYYIAAQIPFASLNPEHLDVLPKLYYEPLPTEQWRDCTADVEAEPIDMAGEFKCRFHEHERNAAIYAYAGYRLRKVQLYSAPRYDETSRLIQAAFVVERKESHD